MKKRKIIIPALLSILACSSIVAGSTYALFTSESKVNVAISSGKVDVVATVNGEITKKHQEWNSTDSKYEEKDGLLSGNCVLEQENQSLKLTNIAPGDKVSFNIKIENKSTIDVKYRTVVKSLKDSGLFSGLKITIDGKEFDGVTARSEYNDFNVNDEAKTINVSIELPLEAGNDFEGKECEICYLVEAIQKNGETPVIEESKKVETNDNNETINEVKIGDESSKASASIPSGVKMEDGVTEVELSVTSATTPSGIVVETDEENKTFNIKMPGLSEDNSVPVTVSLNVGKNITSFKLYHNSTLMNKKNSLEEVTADQDYYYNIDTGIVTFKTCKFSAFTVLTKEEWKSVSSFDELANAKNSATNNNDKTAFIKLTNDIDATAINICSNNGNRIVLDMNNHTINLTKDNYFLVMYGTLEIVGKGSINSNYGYTPAFYAVGSTDSNATNYSNLIVGKDVTINASTCIGLTYTDSQHVQQYGIKINVNGRLNAVNDGITINDDYKAISGSVPEITLGSTSTITSQSSGIQCSVYAKWNLSGNITAEGTAADTNLATGNALSFKSGEVKITGGTYKSNGVLNCPAEGPSEYNKNSGAALCLVSDDTSSKNLNVTITGGEFISENSYGLLECISKSVVWYTNGTKKVTKEKDAEASYANLTITGGTFKGNAGAIRIKDASKDKIKISGITDTVIYN